jgi:choline kinase
MEPKGESPLLLPANEHKQLVVIDFEYASANTPGFEFANHFVSPFPDFPVRANSGRLNGATTTTTRKDPGRAITRPIRHPKSNAGSSPPI